MQPSLAEGLLQAHKGSIAVQTKKNRITGLDHPYDFEYNLTSRFPVSFRGCLICGATDHFSKFGCLVEMISKEERKLFFNEMWAHKPYTKRRNKEGIPVSTL